MAWSQATSKLLSSAVLPLEYLGMALPPPQPEPLGLPGGPGLNSVPLHSPNPPPGGEGCRIPPSRLPDWAAWPVLPLTVCSTVQGTNTAPRAPRAWCAKDSDTRQSLDLLSNVHGDILRKPGHSDVSLSVLRPNDTLSPTWGGCPVLRGHGRCQGPCHSPMLRGGN